MKIRTRLALAFCIIIFVPFVIIFAAYGLLIYSKFTSETMVKIQNSLSGLSLDVIVSASLILILTATILILWMYKGIVPNIKKLTKAADCIKNGDLDFEIEGDGADELSELCDTFEEMRIRLKTNAQEKLEDEQEQKQLISNIAHDLKTPITAIKGYSEGLLDGVANSPKKQEEYVKTIHNKAVEMDNLINELTLYSQLDTKKIPYNFQKINISSYFQEVTCDLSMDLSNQNIKLSYSNYLDDSVYTITDPEQLSRVINNIVTNSVKYNKDNENLIIAFFLYDMDDYVQVDIQDNGIGIPAKDLDHIFDRTYRGDQSRNTDQGGSGIGLSIVKRIVEDHGGRIWVTSNVGRGTKMSFTLKKYQG
ncbi:MAG: HAMP domain-containing histidine kinase [Lachnospiraceae bacterium]|nr:HAMP domain-containing histidine kinase [Lachnospiraceae bacterium]